jgi:hypothetical protein
MAVVLTGNVLCYRDGGIENEKRVVHRTAVTTRDNLTTSDLRKS